MKVFALLCAAAIAVSAPGVDAAFSCTNKVCTDSAASIPITTGLDVSLDPVCETGSFAYVTAISWTGTTPLTDKVTFKTKNADGLISTPTTCATAAAALTDGESPVAKTSLECGKTEGKDTMVNLVCMKGSGNCVGGYSVTFACEDPTAVKCSGTNVCSSTGGKITVGTPKSVTIGTPCTGTTKAFVKAISYTGKDTTDKLAYAVMSGTTAVNGTTCSSADATTGVQTLAEVTGLTCGEGGAADAAVQLTCKKASGDCTADYSVTFGCAEPTAPTPSMGSMVTKANAIVGLISGMVGAVVYFNRG
jgi:hypothetical protein